MDIFLIVLILFISIFTFFIPELCRKRESSLWRLVYLIPLLLAIGFAGFLGWDMGYIGAVAAVLLIMGELFVREDRMKKVLSRIAVLGAVASLLYIAFCPYYHYKDYLGDFEKVYDTMKEHYVLSIEKGIDWEYLYDKYRPIFEEASHKQDEFMCNLAWKKYTQEFYDGHVDYDIADDDRAAEFREKCLGNDYGLSLLKLDDGRYVAVNVEGYENSFSLSDPGDDFEEMVERNISEDGDTDRFVLKNAGIHNGTVITAWDNEPVDSYFDKVEVYLSSFPDRQNELFYLPCYVAGLGGDSVDITFVDDEGNEKNVSAPKLCAYAPRLYSTIEKIDEGMNISNLDWRMVSSDTVLLRIDQMAYDMASYSGSDYSQMSLEIRQMIDTWKENNVNTLILDLRKNGGGSPFMVAGVTSLFAPEGEHVLCYTSVINEEKVCFERGADGKYIKGGPVTYKGEDLWKGRKIIILVNAETVSAGDMMTYIMGEYPNVTVMGFTGSNSSCQAVSSIKISTGEVAYAAVPNLDENGEVIIDTFTDHKSRVHVDCFIPLTQDAVTAIYDKGEDYIIDYVLNNNF